MQTERIFLFIILTIQKIIKTIRDNFKNLRANRTRMTQIKRIFADLMIGRINYQKSVFIHHIRLIRVPII